MQEDKQEYYARMAGLMPLAKTPMDEKGAASLRQYANRIEKSIQGIAPWVDRYKRRGHPGVKPGETVVQLDTGDVANDPLFKGAKIVR